MVSRFEDKNASTQDVIILLKSRDPKALNKLVNVLKEKPLENISSVVSIKDQHSIGYAKQAQNGLKQNLTQSSRGYTRKITNS